MWLVDVLLLLGALELMLQSRASRARYLAMLAVTLSIALSYPLALRIGWPSVQAGLIGSGRLPLVCVVSLLALLTLGLGLMAPHGRLGAALRVLWQILPSPLGLCAVVIVQWRLFHHVDGVAYIVVSGAWLLACGLVLSVAGRWPHKAGQRLWLALAQLFCAVVLAAVAAAQVPLPSQNVHFDVQALLGWLVLIGVFSMLGGMLARRWHW